MIEENRQKARAIIEEAKAKKGLITVLTRRLEQSDDLVTLVAAAELRNDPNWRWLIRGSRYDRRRRKIARKKRRARLNERDHAANACYEKWYTRCLRVLTDDEHSQYEHPSQEIRLELVRLPPIEEDGDETIAPCLSVLLELFYHDPLLSVRMGMWTQNAAAMAMLFAGLELMEKEVNVS